MSETDFPMRKQIRLREFDYTQEGAYFITLCSYTRMNLFGRVRNEIMELNANGRIIHDGWLELPSFYLSMRLDEFIIMPNHFHAIFFLVGVDSVDPGDTTTRPNIGKIIGHFKNLTTHRINESYKTIGIRRWQRNYYEHIIRNERDLFNARHYIQNNPLKCHLDKYSG